MKVQRDFAAIARARASQIEGGEHVAILDERFQQAVEDFPASIPDWRSKSGRSHRRAPGFN